jgi:hypothetical protein
VGGSADCYSGDDDVLDRRIQITGLLGALGSALAGCAVRGAGPRAAVAPPPNVAGVWEAFTRETVSDGVAAGDTRIERQAWRLEQTGGTVRGFYVVELTMVSGDGRPYLCSREPRFQTLYRFEVTGRAAVGGVELEEVGDVLAQGPCRPTFRTPARFRAELHAGALLLLTVGPGQGARRITLQRRSEKEAEALLSFAAPGIASFTSEPAFPTLERRRPDGDGDPPANIQGVWVWEHRGTIASGDEKVEREEWHLAQEGTRLTGYYDRAVRQISTDGQAYRCNNALDFRVVTRYRVTGEVRGNQIALFERAYEILEPSPCDDGQRRLDNYQGEAKPGEIHLMWGVGKQVLRRARPNVPTQRF